MHPAVEHVQCLGRVQKCVYASVSLRSSPALKYTQSTVSRTAILCGYSIFMGVVVFPDLVLALSFYAVLVLRNGDFLGHERLHSYKAESTVRAIVFNAPKTRTRV